MITLEWDCSGLLRRKENWDWRKDTSLKGFKINNFLRNVEMFVLESSLKVFLMLLWEVVTVMIDMMLKFIEIEYNILSKIFLFFFYNL